MANIRPSSYSQYMINRTQLSKINLHLTGAQSGLSSGQIASPALTLGGRMGILASLESRVASIDTLISTNGLVAARLDISKAALDGVGETITEFRSALVSAKTAGVETSQVLDHVSGMRRNTEVLLNTTHSGHYLFSGVHSDRPAIRNLSGDVSVSAMRIDQSFQATFGISFNDPTASEIAPEAFETWLNGDLATLFENPAWEDIWSGASADVSDIRIGDGDFVKSGVSANNPAFRKLMMSFVMMSELGASKVGVENMDVVINSAIETLEKANESFIGVRSEVDSSLAWIERSSLNLSIQKDIYRNESSKMIDVDPFELSMRIGNLQTRLEASYSVTARLSNLSLSRFI